MDYLPTWGERNFWRRSVTILVVQQKGSERQEETSRNIIHQASKKQWRSRQPFASGFLLGAIAAAGVVGGLLELQSRRAVRQEQNVFSWPAIVKPRQR